MSWMPLLNNKPFTFTREDLPALIHGEKATGSSLFSLSLLAQLYFQGEPLVLVSSNSEAKEEFLHQTSAQNSFFEITSEVDFTQSQDKQVVSLSLEQEALLPVFIAHLEDYSERIIMVHTFSEFKKETLALFYPHSKTIYVGNLNGSEAKEPLLQLKYMAKIFFSPLYNDFRLTLPPLEKYHGYYQGRTDTGTVTLKESPL